VAQIRYRRCSGRPSPIMVTVGYPPDPGNRPPSPRHSQCCRQKFEGTSGNFFRNSFIRGKGVPSLRACIRTPLVLRLNAAAARMIDSPCATKTFRRSFSSSVQGALFKLTRSPSTLAGREHNTLTVDCRCRCGDSFTIHPNDGPVCSLVYLRFKLGPASGSEGRLTQVRN
jgi:hypothetical protein